MKKIIVIILTLITLPCACQTYDSLYFELKKYKINFKDEFGRKQGKWSYYKVKLCKNDSSVFNLEPNHILISTTSEGEYLNDRKIGNWSYYTDDYDPCYEGEQQISQCRIMSEYYGNDSIILCGHNPCYVDTAYFILMNKDTSFFFSETYDITGKISGTCLKEKFSDITTCRLLGGKNRDFTRKEFIFKDVDEAFWWTVNGCKFGDMRKN